ncbi:hypothetical protein [Rhodopirellula sp. SWK7]|uniref:hypothetical protein n=1 Tax=Rhodopirellula sp. SWK7 TaxID=595460 RepID=UPI0002BD6DFD|nr:hypothetical protein [Rhodopirellula sp. SWK7]EMI42470.1 hypothetical protein RRSWK_05082 [Rhodopirellula sp. SWK7]
MVKKVIWDRVDASIDDIEAEIYFTPNGNEGFVFSADRDLSFVDLSHQAWQILHALDCEFGDDIELVFCEVKKTFRLPESDLSRGVVKLFRYCSEKPMTDPADFQAGVLYGLIQRDFMEHERQSGKSMRRNGPKVASSNRLRGKDPGEESLLAALKATQPKFAGQKESAIRKAGESLRIKSYTSMTTYIRRHKISDEDWLLEKK